MLVLGGSVMNPSPSFSPPVITVIVSSESPTCTVTGRSPICGAGTYTTCAPFSVRIERFGTSSTLSSCPTSMLAVAVMLGRTVASGLSSSTVTLKYTTPLLTEPTCPTSVTLPL